MCKWDFATFSHCLEGNFQPAGFDDQRVTEIWSVIHEFSMKIPHEIVNKFPWHHLKLTQEIATAEKEGGKVAPHQAALPGRFTMDRSAEPWWI